MLSHTFANKVPDNTSASISFFFRRKQGESSPEEFPWTCLILDGDNGFVGTCAVVPETFDNDISKGTRKVITAAHKLAKVGENE